jgi:hypothetical protein
MLNVPPSGKLDWRIGLTVKPKYRGHELFYERGTVRDVHPSGTGGLSDCDGILRIELVGSGRTFLARASDWMTA